MRPVRILLVVIALLAAGLTVWAFASGPGDRYGASGAAPTPTVTTPAPPQAEPATPVDPAPQVPTGDPGGTPSDTTSPAPRPRILGFGSEPVLPMEGTFWSLPEGAGLVTLVLDAPHATRVEFWLTPTGSGVSDLSRKIGQDSNGRDGWLFNWHYPSEPILGHLTVKAIGPGGTAEETVGVYHPDPAT